MKFILTLQFDLEVETGKKDIIDIEKMVKSSYSESCGAPVEIIKRRSV